ncbi:hypothetical protein GOBAR_AA10618 [Gossypium barbadense]|uniref:Cytochrome P450 n=1 Tax=Gossypium barbadense TaxID=3634 RepID=A0A2P5Y370_GOSBA|nr:hypothetical protein GOBAR_AA10618 [Gossypium barbadense]
MEEATIFYSSLALVFHFLGFNPPSLPVIAHLHLLINPSLQRPFLELSKKLGPVFSLQLGSLLAVVVSSLSLVEECFTKNDIVLANRPNLLLSKHLFYNHTTLITAPYGNYWRNLRRICTIEIFSPNRINKFHGIRKDEMRRLLLKLSRNLHEVFAKVELKSLFADLTFNNLMRMMAGKRYYGEDVTDDSEAKEFRELIAEVVENGGAGNPADYLPILNWDGNMMIDHLLTLQESEPGSYTDQIIKGIILVLLLVGTDTSAVTVEWAMSNLLNNPEVLKKAKAEIDAQVGEERTSGDYTIGGYDVPGNTIVLINAWAIQRDPELWDDPTSFKPERFEKEGKDHGHTWASIAHRMVNLALGALIQCFEWKGLGDEEIDTTEGKGIIKPKVEPLKAMCKARPILDKDLY